MFQLPPDQRDEFLKRWTETTQVYARTEGFIETHLHENAGVGNPTFQFINFALWASKGLSQDWGSGGGRHSRTWIVGWLELLSEAGAERAIVDGAANLEQQVGAAPRPAHLL